MSTQHYDAFISYRHAELDSAVATSLHRKLERFKLPSNLRKKYPKDKWKIRRVFRDQDELPLADNLSDPIEEAIKNSDYLIVICTPRLPESKWCAREIELFKEIHGQEKILAILAEGEPEQSFPEAICYREVESVNEQGETIVTRVSVEPLAADVRSESKSKRNKMLDDAVLRMAAPMYHLGYDDLKQRHREQKIRRIAAISAIAAAVFFVFGMVCMGLMMRINEQKKTITEQKEQLADDYAKSRKDYAESMAVVSEKLLKEGRQQDALSALRSVMPDTPQEEDVEKPYLPSTHYALSNTLGAYSLDVFFPCECMPLPSEEEADSFWGGPGEYAALQLYMGNLSIICAEEMEDGQVLMVTSSCDLFVYDPENDTILDYTTAWFTDPPGEYVTCAAYRDDTLYLQFSQADYVAVYKWLSPDEDTYSGEITYEERKAVTADRLKEGETAYSDDEKYIMEIGANHTIYLYESEHPDEVFKTLYGFTGGYCGLKKLEGTDYYLLIGGGRYSYLLDPAFVTVGRIAYYYDYLPDEKAFLVYRLQPGRNAYDLYRFPLLTYEDLIEEADDLLTGYKPSPALAERYKMLGGDEGE